jgi:hypothetical protein
MGKLHDNMLMVMQMRNFSERTIQAYTAHMKAFVRMHGRSPDELGEDEICRYLHYLRREKKVSYCKRPFGGPEQVLEYLGRYTHRVAISNNRIQRIENGRVFFTWKDYRDNDKVKETSLEVFEFIRRFLLHVLPPEFFKIRYYGILSSRNKRTKLEKCQDIIKHYKVLQVNYVNFILKMYRVMKIQSAKFSY